MTALNKHAELRKELSNLAIGSKHQLRRLALSLLDELEKEKGYASAYEAEKWHYHGLAESEGERADRAEKALEAAEKRIAELEAREVMLPTPYQKGYGLAADKYNFALEECANAIRAAGIGVKGE